MREKFEDIGKRLRSLRENGKKISRRRLANELNIDRNRIERLESGEHEPRISEIKAYSERFQRSEAWIVTGQDEIIEENQIMEAVKYDDHLKQIGENIIEAIWKNSDLIKKNSREIQEIKLRLEFLKSDRKIETKSKKGEAVRVKSRQTGKKSIKSRQGIEGN